MEIELAFGTVVRTLRYAKGWSQEKVEQYNQDRLGVPLLFALAQSLGLPQADLREALATRRYEAKVRGDFLGGVRSGVNGTPCFFVNGRRHDGSSAFRDLAASIAAHLAEAPW